MAIVRIVAVSFVLSVMAFWEIHCEKANIIRDLIIAMPNSTTVALGEHLYTVSKNRSYVHINSTKADYEPCTIAIDPFEDLIQGQMKMEVFYDREIFIWGVQSREINDNISSTYYAFLSIHPRECSYKSFSIPESDDAEIPYHSLPQLIRYRADSIRAVDVFFPSLQKCNPFRFNNHARKTYVYFRMHSMGDTSRGNFFIRWLEPDYFYVHNLNNGTAVLQYLSEDYFAVIKQKYIAYVVETVAVKKGNIRNVGICTRWQNNRTNDANGFRKEILCMRLNSKLQTVVSISIPITFNKDVSSVSLDYDEQGNSYISFAENYKLNVHKYDIDGKILKSYDLGEVDASNRYSHWDVRGFLVGSYEYCVIIEYMVIDYVQVSHAVKCIAV